MHSKLKVTLLATAALGLAATFVWPGCVTPPLPATRKPICSRKTQDFAFLKSGQFERCDMEESLGAPDQYFEDLKVACYRISEVTKRRLWLCLGVIPMGVTSSTAGTEVAFIQLDERDHAQRFGVCTGMESLHREAEDWLAEKAKKPGAR